MSDKQDLGTLIDEERHMKDDISSIMLHHTVLKDEKVKVAGALDAAKKVQEELQSLLSKKGQFELEEKVLFLCYDKGYMLRSCCDTDAEYGSGCPIDFENQNYTILRRSLLLRIQTVLLPFHYGAKRPPKRLCHDYVQLHQSLWKVPSRPLCE